MAEEKIRLDVLLQEELEQLLDDDFYTVLHEEFYKLMFKYIPYDRGALSALLDIEREWRFHFPDSLAISMGLHSSNISKDGIFFPAYYATNVYYNYTDEYWIRWSRNIRHRYHPLATDHWAEVAFEREQDKLINIMDEYLERRIAHEK